MNWQILFTILLLFAAGNLHADQETKNCDRLLATQNINKNRADLKVFRQLVKESEKTHPSTALVIQQLFETHGLKPAFYEHVYLMLKILENRHQIDYTFPDREEVPLSREEKDFLIESFSKSKFDVQSLDSDQIQQFFLNQVRRLYILAADGYWLSQSQRALDNWETTLVEVDSNLVKALANALQEKTGSLYDLTQRSVTVETASTLFSESISLTDEELQAIAQAHHSLQEGYAEEALSLLNDGGFPMNLAEKVVSRWQKDDLICCTSEPGCRTCHLNRAFRTNN